VNRDAFRGPVSVWIALYGWAELAVLLHFQVSTRQTIVYEWAAGRVSRGLVEESWPATSNFRFVWEVQENLNFNMTIPALH
jgi:hypothetical protein